MTRGLKGLPRYELRPTTDVHSIEQSSTLSSDTHTFHRLVLTVAASKLQGLVFASNKTSEHVQVFRLWL
jgi:hypothetical protein